MKDGGIFAPDPRGARQGSRGPLSISFSFCRFTSITFQPILERIEFAVLAVERETGV